MPLFVYSKIADREFLNLPKELQIRVDKKLEELKKHPNIFSVMKKIEGNSLATHRLRIGNYRLLVKLQEGAEETTFLILKIGDRKYIYREGTSEKYLFSSKRR